MPLPKDPVKREEALRNYREAALRRSQNPEYQRNLKEAMQKLARNSVWRDNQKAGSQRISKDPVWQSKQKEGIRKRDQNPIYRNNHKKAMQKLAQDPVWQDNHKKAMQILRKNPEYRDNHTKSMQKLAQDPIWRDTQRKAMQILHKNPEYQLNLQEAAVGGFCIQNITYHDPPRYCEFWCSDLWHRIDAAQNYQSILSGKTKEDNGGRALSRHHVYWQPKACCEWDEDIGGYYAWIETGTKKHPNKVKYYIKGDPNKFVLLTMSEHKMIAKNKFKWIGIFEELIETKLDGVCYLPKPSSGLSNTMEMV